jgi:hypothetical protein
LKKRSIGFRLAAWYFLVFACGLAAFSVTAWFAMRASIYHAVDDELPIPRPVREPVLIADQFRPLLRPDIKEHERLIIRTSGAGNNVSPVRRPSLTAMA